MIPKLRFPEFTDEWQVKKLGDIVTKVGSGSTPKGGSAVYKKSGVPFIRSQNVVNGQLDLSDIVYIDGETHAKMSNSKVLPSDVLLNITGASLGRTCVVPTEFGEGNVNQHVCIIRMNGKADPYLVHTNLSKPRSLHELLKTQTGGGKEGLNFQAVRSFKLSLPSKPEQGEIAGFLGVVDDRVAAMQQKVELLKKYKKGVMQKIFTQQIRFKDDSDNPYPDWEDKRLGDLVKFHRGNLLSKSDIVVNGKYKCIHYGELFTEYGEVIQAIKSHTNLNTRSTSQAGDILMPTSDVTPQGLAKASAINEDGVMLGADINVLRPNSDTNSILLSYMMNFQKKKIMRLVTGTTVRHVYSKDIAKIVYKVPVSAKEQQKIADFLTVIDDKIKLEEAKLTSAKEFKKALLQRMFV